MRPCFFVPSCVVLCRISYFSCSVTQNSMRICTVYHDSFTSFGLWLKTLYRSIYFSEKPPFILQRTFFRRLSGRKLKKIEKKCAVFMESGSAFYLWICDFREQQTQPMYIHSAIFACWEHPKPHSKRELSRAGKFVETP